MKTMRFFVILSMLIMAVSCDEQQNSDEKKKAIEYVVQTVEEAKKNLPVDFGPGGTLVSANIEDDCVVYSYRYDKQTSENLKAVDSQTIEEYANSMKPSVISIAKKQETEKKFMESCFKAGYVIKYKYYTYDGSYLFGIDITEEDFK